MKETKIIDKNYGSIPHLSTSKLTQQADKKIHSGQELILTKKARDWRDLVIVTEKIDGSNVGVVRKGGELKSITRSGYDSITSKYEQHILFSGWVFFNSGMFEWLPEGWRICGEWMLQAHGTMYEVKHPFIAFDIFDSENERIPYLLFTSMCFKYGIYMVQLLHIGQPISIENCIKQLGKGFYGNPEKPEGFVMRLERNNKVEFLAKWVRADKEDGKYLENDQVIWNKGAEKIIEEIKHGNIG